MYLWLECSLASATDTASVFTKYYATNQHTYVSHLFLTSICREQHLEKKIEQLTTEAKAKMAKKDKKGEFY